MTGTMTETSSSSTILMELQRIADLARTAPDMAFTTLTHHIDHIEMDLLREARRCTRKDGAVLRRRAPVGEGSER